jgi:hypothetical protein
MRKILLFLNYGIKITVRSFDIIDFAEASTVVNLAVPYKGPNSDFSARVDEMAKWTDIHCEGAYLIMLTTVIFKLERDALIFKLKYG